MRYLEIKLLLEYDRSITAQRIGPRLLAALKNDQTWYNQIKEQTDLEQIDLTLEQLESTDPTANKQWVPWLAKQYINQEFKIGDQTLVRQILEFFSSTDVKRDFKRKGLTFDINQYSYSKLKAEVQKSIGSEEIGSTVDTGNLKYKNLNQMLVLHNSPLGTLLVPKTEAASCEIGSGTEWCTAWKKEKNQFNKYNKEGPLFVWIEPNGTKYQLHFESYQFMDKNDREIDTEIIKNWRTKHPVLSKVFKIKEPVIARNSKNAYEYALNVIEGRWPEGEPAIAKDSFTAYWYARYVIRGRWPEGEPAIAQNPYWAPQYARDVIRGRWPEAEPAIAQNPYWAVQYARDVIKGRWPEAEPAIAQNFDTAYNYARDVIKGRWPEAESIIAKDANIAYNYARDVIGGRWLEAESTIAKNSLIAYRYARDVIKGRWPEGEPAIAQNPQLAVDYVKEVIKGRWPEAEPNIAKHSYPALLYATFLNKPWGNDAVGIRAKKSILKNYYDSVDYAQQILKKPWPEFKERVLKNNKPKFVYNYVLDMLNGKRWPAGEPIIAQDPKYAYEYAANVLRKKWPKNQVGRAAEEAIKTKPRLYKQYLELESK